MLVRWPAACQGPRPRAGQTAAGGGVLTSVGVVLPGLNDDQLIVGYAVDQTVLVIDPPGPEPRQIAAQRLRLSGALEWSALGFPGQSRQAAQHFLAGCRPVAEVFPALRAEDDARTAAGPRRPGPRVLPLSW